MPMRIDEPRHDRHAVGIDLARCTGRSIAVRDRDDAVAVDYQRAAFDDLAGAVDDARIRYR